MFSAALCRTRGSADPSTVGVGLNALRWAHALDYSTETPKEVE